MLIARIDFFVHPLFNPHNVTTPVVRYWIKELEMATPVQRLRAIQLYRNSLKTMLSWAVRREVFWVEVRVDDSQNDASVH